MTGRIGEDAFEFYVGLGPNRSYEAVAEHYDVNKRSVTRCAKREEWTQRLTDVQRTAREKSDQRLADTIEDMRSRHLTTLKAMHARALTALRQFPLNTGMEAMKAAEMVIKLERLVAGEASDRTAISVEEVTKRELDRWVSLRQPENGEGEDD